MPKVLKPEDRTVTRSFRINERALKSIEDESKRHNVGVSTIINQQLLAYSEFERYFRRLGLIKISAATFQRLIQAGSEIEIGKAGYEAGSDTPRSIILAKNGILSLTTVIEYLRILSEFANQFEFGQIDRDGKHVITLLHNLGSKGSIFFASYAKGLFESIGDSPKITSSAHSVVIEVSQKSESNSF